MKINKQNTPVLVNLNIHLPSPHFYEIINFDFSRKKIFDLTFKNFNIKNILTRIFKFVNKNRSTNFDKHAYIPSFCKCLSFVNL